jgi:ASC-1-like (ASCH) protein
MKSEEIFDQEWLTCYLQDLKSQEIFRSVHRSALIHLLSKSKRSRRRNRHLVKQIYRRVRHPELGVAYILRKMGSRPFSTGLFND